MKIAMLLSGGVDSSVALSELVRTGEHDITAFYLKIWLEDELQYLGNCPWEEDLKYASEVCEKLKIKLEVIPLQKEYWDRVVGETIAELRQGRTPSPDILCNQRVKFGAFDETVGHHFDKIATGHYAQISTYDGIYHLKKGVDPIKDQTYFLSHLSQKQLSKALFPIGGYPKAQVRELARDFSLATMDRRDSQGICFLGKIKFRDFVKAHLGEREGNILEWETQKKLGNHRGFWFHTIGQRKGLGLGGGPWFVVAKDLSQNIIYVSSLTDQPQNSKKDFIIGGVNWISGYPKTTDLTVKIRHGEHTTKCSASDLSDGRWAIAMEKEDPGVAPGQYAVLYNQEHCLGGGIIQ